MEVDTGARTHNRFKVVTCAKETVKRMKRESKKQRFKSKRETLPKLLHKSRCGVYKFYILIMGRKENFTSFAEFQMEQVNL